MEPIEDGALGGFVAGGDPRTFEANLWDALITDYQVKSVLDVGCGEGYSSKYFQDRGLKVLAIDGSKEALKKAVFKGIVIHDYTEGIYSPHLEYDLAWCCEFVEHVEEQYMDNYFATLKKAKIVAMTHALPGQGGYHHVNEKPAEYWIGKFKERGFDFDLERSKIYQEIAQGIYFRKTGMILVRG